MSNMINYVVPLKVHLLEEQARSIHTRGGDIECGFCTNC